VAEGSAEEGTERWNPREYVRHRSLTPTPGHHLIPTQVEFQWWTPCLPWIQICVRTLTNLHPLFTTTSISRVLEMQAFLVELVNHFEFEMTEDSSNIKRVPSFVMAAVIRGQEENSDAVEGQVCS